MPTLYPHTCPHCGREFPSPWKDTKFCSRDCRNAFRRSGTIRNGYRLIRVGGRQVAEHRHVMEQALGRRLLMSEVVHHRNGDKLDNRPENLELFHSQSDHMQEHRQTYSSALHRQCSKCGQIKSHDDFYLRNDRPDGLHSHCKDCQHRTPGGARTHRFRSETHKQCSRCEEIKPRTEFHRCNAPRKDPNVPHCMVCHKASYY